MEKFNDPKNVKKSFEIKVENDDDDEIFIVHDAEDEDGQEQDDLFVTPPSNIEVTTKAKTTETAPLFLDLQKVD